MSEQQESGNVLRGPFAEFAKQHGVDVDVQIGDNPGAPTASVINVMKPILQVQLEVAQAVRGEGLYIRDGRLMTIEEDGTELEMDGKRFISFLPRFAVVAKGTDDDGKPRRIDLSAKRAEELLAGDLFRGMIPEVRRVLPARLPVLTSDGRGVRLLKKGYDPELKAFVTSDAPDVEDWDPERGRAYLRELLGPFPWGDAGRSMAAHLSAMTGMFVQMFFPDALAVPLFYYNANMEGSGKSILAEMTIAPIYGRAETDDFGQDQEFKAMLASRAFGYASYLFLDDVEGVIKSQTLNRWVIQPFWADRQLYSRKMVTVPKRCMTLITGNRATLWDDLIRRAVQIDLFSEKSAAERLEERKGITEVTSKRLRSEDMRTEILSALWSLVRSWADQGMPAAPRRIASFVEWTDIVGGIVAANGFGDPFEPAMLEDAGNKWEVEWMKLFSTVVRKFKPTKEGVSIPLPEWCACARGLGLYVEKLWELETVRAHLDENPRLYKGEPSMMSQAEKDDEALRYMHPQKQASPWAKILRKRGGRTFEVDGRRYRFADRNTSTSTFTVYAIEA